MAYVEKRGPGRWRARYRGPDGRERSKTFERRVDAQQWLDRVHGDLARGEYVDPWEARRVTVASYAEQWMALQPWRQSTRDSTLSGLRRILPVFGERPIGSCGLASCRRGPWAWRRGCRRRPSRAPCVS